MLIWSDNYITGIEEIDQQHQEIFRKSNAIFTAMKLGQSTAVLVPMMRIMRDYLQEHYNTEQFFMEKYCYPGFQEHSEMHDAFLEQLTEWVNMNTAGKSIVSGPEIQKRLSSAMLTHISIEDARFGIFILEQYKAA